MSKSLSTWRAARALRLSAGSKSPNSTDTSRRRAAATLIAMSFETDQSVRVYRLHGDYRLKQVARTQLEKPLFLLWLAEDRLLATEQHISVVAELKVKGAARNKRGRQLIAPEERIAVYRWCAVGDELAIVEKSGDLLFHSLA